MWHLVVLQMRRQHTIARQGVADLVGAGEPAAAAGKPHQLPPQEAGATHGIICLKRLAPAGRVHGAALDGAPPEYKKRFNHGSYL